MNRSALLPIIALLFLACHNKPAKTVSVVKTIIKDTLKSSPKLSEPEGITGAYYDIKKIQIITLII